MKFEEWIKGIENAAIKGLCSTHPNICRMIYNEAQKDIIKALKEKGVCLQTELDEANSQIEKMKCCENCKHSSNSFGDIYCALIDDDTYDSERCSIGFNTENNDLWELRK